MSIKSQGHSLILVKGHSDFKVKCLTFGQFTQVSDSGPQGPLVVICFLSTTVARRVANRNHKLEEVDLSVSLYKPPKQRPFYGNRVIIEGESILNETLVSHEFIQIVSYIICFYFSVIDNFDPVYKKWTFTI